MSDIVLATVCGLVAFLFWGVSDWLAAKSSKLFSSYEVNVALRPGSLILGIVLLATNLDKIPDSMRLMPVFVVCFLFTGAYIFLIKALATGKVGIVIPIVSVNPMVAVLLAIVVGNRLVSPEYLVSMSIIMLGILLLAYQKNREKQPLKELHRETAFSVIAMLLWGIGLFVLEQKATDLPWQIVFGLFGIVNGLLAICLLAAKFKTQTLAKIKNMSQNKSGLASGLFLMIGTVTFFYGINEVDNVLALIVIAASAPLVTSGLSMAVDHERIGYIKRLGAVMVIGGIILLNVLSA